MRYLRRHRHYHQDQLRHYATKYTAKITSSSASGRSLSAEVLPPPPPPPLDPYGYPIPRHDLICRATQILLNQSHPSTSSPRNKPLNDDPFSLLSNYFHTLSPPLTNSEASLILKSLNCPSLAMRFFRFCPSFFPNFQHCPFTYNRLLLILSKSAASSRVLDQVRELVSEMEWSGTHGTISTVNLLIGIFGKSEDLEKCLDLVKKWGLKMNGYTYKCLVQAYLRSYDTDRAFGVYVDMRRKGYKLDIFGYNMLLDALAKHEKSFVRLTKLLRFLKT